MQPHGKIRQSIESAQSYAASHFPQSCIPVVRWLTDTECIDQPIRQKVRTALKSKRVELLLGLVIVLNIFMVITDVDTKAKDEDAKPWTTIVNDFLLAVYITEACVRFVAERLEMFKEFYGCMDVFLIFMDLCIPSSITIFRVIRVTKVCRAMKCLHLAPELHLMMKGMSGATKSILWGTILTLTFVVTWAILAVALIHPLNKEIPYVGCERCPHAYESTFMASLTLVQTLVAGDSWGHITMPIIERHPWTGIYFGLAFASICLASLNMMLAMVVDSAQEARKGSVEYLANLRMQEQQGAKIRLEALCSKMDTDSGGSLDIDEIRQGYRNIKEFGDSMKMLGIMEEDLDKVFDLMDQSGTVSAEEFCKESINLQCQDIPSVCLHTKLMFNQLNRRVEKMIRESKLETKVVNDEIARMQNDIHQEVLWISRGIAASLPPSPKESGAVVTVNEQRTIIGSMSDSKAPIESNPPSQTATVLDALCASKLTSLENAIADLMESIRVKPMAVASIDEVQFIVRMAMSLLQLSTAVPSRSGLTSSVSALDREAEATSNGANRLRGTAGVDKGFRVSM